MSIFQIGKIRASKLFVKPGLQSFFREFVTWRRQIAVILLFFSISVSAVYCQISDTTLLYNVQIDSFLRKEDVFEVEGLMGVSRIVSRFPFPSKLPKGVVVVNYSDSKHRLLEATVNEGGLNGEMKVFYPSGVIKERMNFVNNTMEGTYLRFSIKGNLSFSIEIKAGSYHGAMTKYYDNGYYSERQYYESGKPTGKRDIWHMNGVKLCEYQEDDYSHTNGYCRCWYDNGSKSFEGYFFGQLPIGEVKYYYRNGNIKKQGYALSFVNDTLSPNMYNIRLWELNKDGDIELHSFEMYSEWYEDGSPKVIVTPDTNDSMRINAEYFHPNMQVKAKGSMVLLEVERNDNYLNMPTIFYGWEKKGPWFSWSEQGELVEKIEY